MAIDRHLVTFAAGYQNGESYSTNIPYVFQAHKYTTLIYSMYIGKPLLCT